MDVVKTSMAGAVVTCATLMLLTTAPHGRAEPSAAAAQAQLLTMGPYESDSGAGRTTSVPQPMSLPSTTGPAVLKSEVHVYGDWLAPPPTFASAAEPSWEALITEASQRFGVQPSWVRAVMQAESAGRTIWNGRPITSSAGAMGLMQVMPETFAEMTRRYGLGNDPYEPRANIMAGTAFLREMYDRFGAEHFLAAYNAGPGRVEDHLRFGRPLPNETRRYVQTLAPRLVGSTNVDASATSGEARDPTSVQALQDVARFPSRRLPIPRPFPEAAPLFVASNDRPSADDRQASAQTNDALFVHLTREDQRRTATADASLGSN